jgi:hypothetical protein
MTAPTDSATPTPPEPSSIFEDIIDVFFAPAAMFARRAGRSPWLPFLLVSLMLAGMYLVNVGNMQGIFDTEVARAVAQASEKNPNLTEAQTQGMVKVMEVSMKWGAVAIMPIILLVLAAATLMVGKLVGGTLGYGTALTIASLAYLPKLVEFALVSVQSLIFGTAGYVGRYQFSLGVGRFLDSTGKQGLYNFLGRIDVITIWVTVLLVIGLIHAGKIPKAKALGAGALLWCLGALPAVWQMIQGQ